MRLLFIALLSAIGFVASAAEPSVAQRSIAQDVHRVIRERDIAGLAAQDAPPVYVPAQAVECSARTLARQNSGSDFTAGFGGRPGTWTQREADESLTTPDTPAVGTSTRRRQPEGRGPPRGPIAA